MHASQLISIGLFTAAVVLTIYAWMDRIRYSKRYYKPVEGFETNPLEIPSPDTVPVIEPSNPSDADAIAAHRTLLKYTSQNLAKGLRFIKAIGDTFFVQPTTIKTNFDPATLLNNYISPLQAV